MAKFLGSAKAKPTTVKAGLAAVDAEMSKQYPALMEFMTITVNDDKTPRETATVLIFAEAGLFKGCLSDRETQQTLWASSDTFEGLLEALEAMLQSGSPQWRQASKKPRK